MFYFVLTLLAGIFMYQFFVSVLVLRAYEYDRTQKILQLVLIWLLPLISALVVHGIEISNRKSPSKKDKNFIPQERQVDIPPSYH